MMMYEDWTIPHGSLSSFNKQTLEIHQPFLFCFDAHAFPPPPFHALATRPGLLSPNRRLPDQLSAGSGGGRFVGVQVSTGVTGAGGAAGAPRPATPPPHTTRRRRAIVCTTSIENQKWRYARMVCRRSRPSDGKGASGKLAGV
jgi:hypothetical protein